MLAPDSKTRLIVTLPGVLIARGFEALLGAFTASRPFYEPSEFDWIPQVEAQTPAIQEELRALLNDLPGIPEFKQISEAQENITENAPWRSFAFFAYGDKVEKNCARCPNTVRALQMIPGMTSAMFSIFTPGVRLTPHKGPYKGVLRYHLGLKVPADPKQCGIRVGNEVRHWAEGKSMIFDDTLEHAAWNESDSIRVVLFVDFLRPLPPGVGLLNRGMVDLLRRSTFIQSMVANANAIAGRVDDVQAIRAERS